MYFHSLSVTLGAQDFFAVGGEEFKSTFNRLHNGAWGDGGPGELVEYATIFFNRPFIGGRRT